EGRDQRTALSQVDRRLAAWPGVRLAVDRRRLERVVEDAGVAADDRLRAAADVPREAGARREVVVVTLEERILIPAHADIQRQAAADVPVVLPEHANHRILEVQPGAAEG